MSYIEEKIEKLKKGSFEDYSYGRSGVVTALWDYTLGLDRVLDKHGDIKSGMFIYYERLYDGKSLLSFRMPESDSHLIFKTFSQKRYGKERRIVSIISMQGEDAWTLLNLIARTIIPLFRELEEFYEFWTGDYSDVSIIDVSSKRCRRRTLSLEDVMDTAPEKVMRPVGSKISK